MTKCLSHHSQLYNFAIIAIINSMLTSWDPMDDDEMLMPRCKGDICSSEQLEHTMCTYACHNHQSSSSALLGLTRALYAAPFPLLVQECCCVETEFGIWPKHCMGRTSRGSFYMLNSKSCLFAPRKSMFAIHT